MMMNYQLREVVTYLDSSQPLLCSAQLSSTLDLFVRLIHRFTRLYSIILMIPDPPLSLFFLTNVIRKGVPHVHTMSFWRA